MAEQSSIEWTDHTFNPWSGCTKVAPECQHCYAEVNYSVKMRGVQWGPNGNRVLAADSMWKQPLKWNRQAEVDGVRRRVFCASLADVFEDWEGPILNAKSKVLVHSDNGWIPEDNEQAESCSRVTMDDIRSRLFELIDATPNLDWQLLTKRPANVMGMWRPRSNPDCKRCCGDGCDPEEWQGRHPMFMDPDPCRECCYRHNVWMGTSAGCQSTADNNIPALLKCRNLSPVLFVSCEPMLSKVDLIGWLHESNCPIIDESICTCCSNGEPRLDWVIVGGESGPHARPMDGDWVRNIQHQCQLAYVPFFFKQWGGTNKKMTGRILDGRTWDEFPNVHTSTTIPVT